MSGKLSEERATKEYYCERIEKIARNRKLTFMLHPRGRHGDSLEFRISDGQSEVFGIVKESEAEEIWLGVSNNLLEFTAGKNVFVVEVDKLQNRCLVLPYSFMKPYVNPLHKDDFTQQGFVIARANRGYIIKKLPHLSLDKYVENLDLLFNSFEKAETQESRRNDVSAEPAQIKRAIASKEDVTHEISVEELPIIAGRTLDERVKEKIYYVDEVKLEQANEQHKRLVSTFARFFKVRGLDPKQIIRTDLVTVSGTYIWLFEMKSLTEENEKKQTRNAIGQLFDYEFIELSNYRLLNTHKIMKALAFERKPTDETITFLHYVGIYVFWLDNNGNIAGDLDSLLKTLPMN